MTAVAERPAPTAPGRVTTAGKPAGHRIDAVTILTIWVILLIGIPAALVVEPLGAVGGPATIFAAVVLIIYLVTWLHPALAPAKGRQPVRAAAIVLTCAVIGTYVSANRHIMPGLERNGIDRGLILIFGWLGILIMASDGIPSIERLKKLLGRVVIGVTAMATVGITQFFTGLDATQYIIIPGLQAQTLNTDLLSRNGLNRPSATAAHPLEFAAVLGMVLPIAINRARFAPPGKRAIRWIQVGLIGAALPLTVSRSAVLAILAGAFVLLPSWPKVERRIAYVVIALGVAGLWILVPGLAGTFRTLFATLSGDSSTTSRTSAFSTAMPYISQHPWFGRGFGTFFPATYFFTDDQYLLSLIEIGAVGLFALLALFVTGLVTAQRVRRVTKDPEMRDLGQSLTATITVAMVAFGTFDALSFNMAAGLTFLLLGCAGAALRLLRAQGAQSGGQLAGLMMRPDQEPPALWHPPKPGAAGAAAPAGVTNALAGLRTGRSSNVHLSAPDQSQPAEKPSEQQANGLPPTQADQQPERPAETRQEEHVDPQVEKWADGHLGGRGDGQPERKADGHPAGLAGAALGEPAHAQVKEPAKPPWEDQLWPWEPQDLQAEPHEEQQPVEAQAEQPAAPPGQSEVLAEPPEPQAEQPEEPPGLPADQVKQPKEPPGLPADQVKQPEEPPGLPADQVKQPEEPPGLPADQAEQPADVQAEQPADVQAEQPTARAELPAQAPWDPWRGAERSFAQPTAAAADDQAAEPSGHPTAEPAEAQSEQPAEAPWDLWRKTEPPAGQPTAEAPGQQAREPAADQPAPEPAGERPEETTIPIPIIRD
jgi:polysaccharide biosynthesis protein PslJ